MTLTSNSSTRNDITISPERNGAAGAERAQLHERLDDRSRDGRLHGDAERGGAARAARR